MSIKNCSTAGTSYLFSLEMQKAFLILGGLDMVEPGVNSVGVNNDRTRSNHPTGIVLVQRISGFLIACML